jgi:hypothetical protein
VLIAAADLLEEEQCGIALVVEHDGVRARHLREAVRIADVHPDRCTG